MSKAHRHRANWLSQNYDRLVLILILIGLLLSALILFLQIGRNRQKVTEGAWLKLDVEPKPVHPIAPLLARFDQLKAAIDAPFQAGVFSNGMMVSELRVSCVGCQKPIPFHALVCPFSFCQAKQPDITEVDSDGDGIPDTFEREQGMDPMDPHDAVLDRDNDGFSNVEEFRAGSKPNDESDFPSPAAKLRVLQIGANPFKLRFQGEATLPNGGIRYQLNLRSLQKTYFVRVGDELEGFKVVEYSTNTPAGATIVLEQGGKRILLVKGKMREGFEMVADLVFLIDQSKMRVRLGDTIKLKDREYKIIDIQRDTVLIRDEKTKKTTPVSRLSDSEKSVLEGGVSNPAQSVYALPGIARPLK